MQWLKHVFQSVAGTIVVSEGNEDLEYLSALQIMA